MFNKKKKYFKNKLSGVQKMIWDLEFKRAKMQAIREDIRQEYDNLKSKLYVLEVQIKSQAEKPTIENEEIVKLGDNKIILDRDIERLQNQMKMLDIEVAGAKSTNENPEGINGVNQQLDSLQELKVILKDYIKSL